MDGVFRHACADRRLFLSNGCSGQSIPLYRVWFLFVSILFVLLMSLMYMHKWTKKSLIIVVINAVVAPSLVWLILAKLFAITLP